MKLCFLGGTDSIHLKRWIRYFASRDHEIHWISLEPISETGESYFKGIRLYPIRRVRLRVFSLFNFLYNAVVVRRLVRRINPDLLHAHYASVVGAIGALTGFHPFIITPWGHDVLILPQYRMYRAIVKFALKKADLITCDGENTRQAMIHLGVNSRKIEIICFGVDTRKFQPKGCKEDQKRRLFGFDSQTVISLRGLESFYDIGTLIKAIAIVLSVIPDTKFVIAGDGKQKEYLKNLSKELNVSHAVRFVGMVRNDELPNYLNSADVYVSTSLTDSGLAASTAEAMACGLPVVITDSGSNRDWVRDGENGFIIPLKSPEKLAERVIDLLGNGELRKKFGQIGRRVIEERNNYFVEMGKMEDIYRKLKRPEDEI